MSSDFKIEKKLPRGRLGRAGVLWTPHGEIKTPCFVAVGTKATVKALTPLQLKEIGAEVVLANTYHLYLEPGEEIVKQGGGVGEFMGWDGPTITDSGGFQVFSLGAGFGKNVGKVVGLIPPLLKEVPRSAEAEDLNPSPSPTRVPARTGSGGLPLRKGELRKEVLPLAKIDEDGVTFKSYKDGSEHRFTPERSIEIQHALGADIIFAFDECTSPTALYKYQREAMERTHRWALRSLEAHERAQCGKTQNGRGLTRKKKQMLFGIVQGGRFEDLRKESAKKIGAMGFDGFGIGGSFDKKDMDTAVRWVNEILPEGKPRHLLGIGDPHDLFGAIENGCDLFDCVAPTRIARNGSLYTARGIINITNAQFVRDFTPIEKGCLCYTCQNFTRAYLAHLFRSHEILANTLASIHNLHFIIHLVKNIRTAILDGSFLSFKKSFLAKYR